MSDKHIKNEQWTVKHLISKIKNKEISKPKFQRKRKWDILQKKENVPSEKNYITFLFDTHNSVHAITFGQLNNDLSNIDGNNRINAIHHFLEEPFELFEENLEQINIFVDANFKNSETDKIKQIIKKITYNDLMTFKYNKYFMENGYADLYNETLKNKRDEMEPYFDDLISKLKIKGDDRFDTNVLINVNLFEGYTTEELCKVFTDINKYNGGLTEIEALASRLFNVNNFVIQDSIIKTEITECIKEIYLERENNEVLDCYKYNEFDDIMNAYDFMIGFQNYANKKCSLIHKIDNDGLSLFFKLYKTMYKGGFDENFTTENVNDFIHYIKKAIEILTKIKNNVFMENLVGSNKIFDGCNKKIKCLKKNNLYLILSSIISYIKRNTSEKDILSSIEKCLLMHFFVNEISNKDIKDKFKLLDNIVYEAGGAFIDSKAKEFYKNPSFISEKITKDIMIEVINQLIDENTMNKEYIENNKKRQQRRPRKLYEKALLYYYYTNKVPVEYLKNNFWVEHVFPFSSSWTGNIDIDRLGNIIPLIDGLNIIRSNKSISEYYSHNKAKFIKYIDDIIPKIEIYNEIISHDGKKPTIKNVDGYNDLCHKNEQILKGNLIDYLFPNDLS